VSHFFSVLLLLTTLMLTLCFGVAAWRVSDEAALVRPCNGSAAVSGTAQIGDLGSKPTPTLGLQACVCVVMEGRADWISRACLF
jgi:hypothetical protein